MKLRIGVLLILFILPVSSCRKNHYRVRTSSVKVNIEPKRLEKDLFTLDPAGITNAVPALKARYGSFLQLFSYVINTGSVDDPAFGDFLVRFCTDKQNNEVYQYTMKVYPEVNGIKKNLDEAFRHYLYYFPDRYVPGFYTCITGFNNSIITGDSVLAVSLDRYLGADCRYYPELGIYKYMSDRMTPDYVVPDCIYGWASSEWTFDSTGYASDNLISEMVHNGKLKYFEKCMLPEIPDEIIFGFSPAQMKFCRDNELRMWQYLIEHNMIYSTDQLIIKKLTGEAPFTSYFTNDSPGRAAVWTGFRIVESYMMKNPRVKLEDLMNETDIQKILSGARYNPS